MGVLNRERYINNAQLLLVGVGLLMMIIMLVMVIGSLIWALQWLVIRYGRAGLTFVISVWRSIRSATLHHPAAQALTKKYPRFFVFIKARFDRTHFYGLTLTLSAFALFYVTMLLGGIVEDYITTDSIVYFDKHLAQWISTFRTADILQFFIWITELGNAGFVFPLVFLIAVALFFAGRSLLIAPLFTSLFGSLGLTLLGKASFQRPRPFEAVLLEQSYSFPSGHATLAVGFYGFLTYLLIRHSDSWKAQVRYFLAGSTLAVLMGLSRIVLGVHYLSDVWAGFLVGTMWLIISISLTEWLVSINRVHFKEKLTATRKRLAAIFLASTLIYYISFAALYQPQYTPEFTPAPVEPDGALTYRPQLGARSLRSLF